MRLTVILADNLSTNLGLVLSKNRKTITNEFPWAYSLLLFLEELFLFALFYMRTSSYIGFILISIIFQLLPKAKFCQYTGWST